MPGYIIQGQRGEGKSLCAVHLIKKYMLAGKPVASNLNLFLDKLLPSHNSSLAYRLPDFPRLEDFQLLPPAYDIKYKGQDKNGLLVLDEMGTWLNSRNWSDKQRLKLLNWLFLSRKLHWDIILLAQDHEMIDTQARTTLCEHLVQSARSDKQKIPYLGKLLGMIGKSPFMPNVHNYFVFYGTDMTSAPVDKWRFTGHDIYDAYDTNQLFRDDLEPYGGTLVDMRSTYTYLPANYLSGHVHIARIEQKKTDLIAKLSIKEKGDDMAAKAKLMQNHFAKPMLIMGLLLVFISWKAYAYFTGKETNKLLNHPDQPQQVEIAHTTVFKPVQIAANTDFLHELFTNRTMRLTSFVSGDDIGLVGRVAFFKDGQMTESLSLSQLSDRGAIVSKKSYGLEIYYNDAVYNVSNYNIKLPETKHTQKPKEANSLISGILN